VFKVDSLRSHLGRKFSTHDQDNDVWPGRCAVEYKGAWWYGGCHESNLNGQYNNTEAGKGVNWHHWHDMSYSLRFTELKLRPSDV